MRDRGKLIEARDLFRICSRTTCPGVVRKDCSKWLAEIEESLPSIVIAARDAAGADVTAVKISVDGELVATRADGKPISIDPGEHVLRFEMDGTPAKSEPVVIRTGERNRLIRVELGAAKSAPPNSTVTPGPVGPSAPVGPTEPDRPGGGGDPPIAAYVLGGVGVVALGSFAFFGLTAKADLDSLKGSCAPYCDQAELDSVKSRMLVADVSLGVGIVSLALATVFFFTHGSSAPVKATGLRSVGLSTSF